MKSNVLQSQRATVDVRRWKKGRCLIEILTGRTALPSFFFHNKNALPKKLAEAALLAGAFHATDYQQGGRRKDNLREFR